ncbi:hypothetical protein HNP84_007111 [Thermocatellispora tengchongensis]|uniref:EthD family reductase n=1 Tax=Thermocatellispora tengchongensis TaxID=1073253 RepID=A0A840PEE6_9ACTN|nr:DUF4286 family protein [Thermocatellispora tengchongensis]MBB5137359.1 hypothetical protein [Thermocatellispora tengchongensis]
MAKALMLTWTSPASGDAEAFEEWYTTTHIPDVRAAIPSVTRVTRYELVDPAAAGPSNRYLAVYELDEDDVRDAAAKLSQAVGAGRVTSEGVDLTGNPPRIEFYVRRGPED